MVSPKEAKWHVCCECGGYRGVGEAAPLIPECPANADFITAADSTRIVVGREEHVLSEFGVLLGQNSGREQSKNEYNYMSFHLGTQFSCGLYQSCFLAQVK